MAAAIHRPQCRTGMALMASGRVGAAAGPPAAAIPGSTLDASMTQSRHGVALGLALMLAACAAANAGPWFTWAEGTENRPYELTIFW